MRKLCEQYNSTIFNHSQKKTTTFRIQLATVWTIFWV